MNRRRLAKASTLTLYGILGGALTVGRKLFGLADTAGNAGTLGEWWNALRALGGAKVGGPALLLCAAIGGILLAWDAALRASPAQTTHLLDHRGTALEIRTRFGWIGSLIWVPLVLPGVIVGVLLLRVAFSDRPVAQSPTLAITPVDAVAPQAGPPVHYYYRLYQFAVPPNAVIMEIGTDGARVQGLGIVTEWTRPITGAGWFRHDRPGNPKPSAGGEASMHLDFGEDQWPGPATRLVRRWNDTWIDSDSSLYLKFDFDEKKDAPQLMRLSLLGANGDVFATMSSGVHQ